MKKTKSSILAILLVTVMSFTLMTSTACKDDKVYYNNENDPLVFSSAEVDKVFNPFFSTNAADSSVVGMTQIGMLTNDKDGKPVCGKEYPTVAEKLVIADNGKEEDKGLQTTYYFVLKNDLKFSDGSPLTIKDVLFNLYVYLDPVYTGSSTIYSTDIVGLKAYRSNTRDENEQDSFRDQFEIKAESRIDALLDTVSEAKERISDGLVDNVYDGMVEYLAEMAGKTAYAHVMDDYTKATEFFKEELATDFSNSMDSYSEMKFYDENKKVYENMFTTDVEVFLYNEGYITWNKKEAKMYCSAKNDYKDVRGWTKKRKNLKHHMVISGFSNFYCDRYQDMMRALTRKAEIARKCNSSVACTLSLQAALQRRKAQFAKVDSVSVASAVKAPDVAFTVKSAPPEKEPPKDSETEEMLKNAEMDSEDAFRMVEDSIVEQEEAMEKGFGVGVFEDDGDMDYEMEEVA